MSPTAADSGETTRGPIWTPVARVLRRLEEVEVSAEGTSEHFEVALYASNVLLKTHTIAALAAATALAVEPPSVGYGLTRAIGIMPWNAELARCIAALKITEDGPDTDPLAAWTTNMKRWLGTRRRLDAGDDFARVAEPLARLHETLLNRSERWERVAPMVVFQQLVEIRNKTKGHGAPGSAFYGRNAGTVADAVRILIRETTLWEANLVFSTPSGPLVLEGVLTEPKAFAPEGQPGAVHMQIGSAALEVPPLLYVEPGTLDTYLLNGAWRSDASAEFICEAIDPTVPGEECRRLRLPEYAFVPELPASETEGGGTLSYHDDVPHQLPARPQGFVPRGQVQVDLTTRLRDPWRRHVVTLRGFGGMGKTSLVLEACHQLVVSAEECPYDAIVWMSARDVDLTPRGPKAVRRATATLRDVFLRFAQVFEFPDAGNPERAEGFARETLTNPKCGTLVVLDNFETFEDQKAIFDYVSEVVRPPSKAVITTRHELIGESVMWLQPMSVDEAAEVLRAVGESGGRQELFDVETVRAIHDRCDGNPYLMKLVGAEAVARGSLHGVFEQVYGQDELLDALFRRSVEAFPEDGGEVFVFFVIAQLDRGAPRHALRVACDLHGVDLEQAARELDRRSLIEIRGDVSSSIYDMPSVARIFGRRLIEGHLRRSAVRDAVAVLDALPELFDDQPGVAVDGIFADLKDRERDIWRRVDADGMRSIVRSLAGEQSSLWRVAAAVERSLGFPEDVWGGTYKRAVEAAQGPRKVQVMLEWAAATKVPARQVELRLDALLENPRDIALGTRVARFLRIAGEKQKDLFPAQHWRRLRAQVIEALTGQLDRLDLGALVELARLALDDGRQTAAAERALQKAGQIDPRDQAVVGLRSRLLVQAEGTRFERRWSDQNRPPSTRSATAPGGSAGTGLARETPRGLRPTTQGSSLGAQPRGSAATGRPTSPTPRKAAPPEARPSSAGSSEGSERVVEERLREADLATLLKRDFQASQAGDRAAARHLTSALSEADRGRVEAARLALEKAEQAASGYGPAVAARSFLDWVGNEPARVGEAYASSIASGHDSAELRFAYSDHLLSVGRTDEALHQIEEAVALGADRWRVRTAWTTALIRAGRFADARESMQEAHRFGLNDDQRVELQLMDIDLQFEQARRHFEGGRLAKAIRSFRVLQRSAERAAWHSAGQRLQLADKLRSRSGLLDAIRSEAGTAARDDQAELASFTEWYADATGLPPPHPGQLSYRTDVRAQDGGDRKPAAARPAQTAPTQERTGSARTARTTTPTGGVRNGWASTSDGMVRFGDRVVVADQESNAERSYTIVEAANADPREGRLSAESPLGVALVGRRVGQRAMVKTRTGTRTLQIVEIHRPGATRS
jgi:tetratricopeptide (TPR) repeat protein